MRGFTKCLTPVVWAAVASLLATVPAAAAGPAASGAGAPRPSIITTLSPATLARLQTPARQTQTPNTTAADGSGFFSSKKGAAVLVLLAAGCGYTLYSKVHDRVQSQAR